jgi:hypothetical protein
MSPTCDESNQFNIQQGYGSVESSRTKSDKNSLDDDGTTGQHLTLGASACLS